MEVRLKDILDIRSGYSTTPKSEFEFIDTGIKLLRITDIQNHHVKWNSVPCCEISPAKLKTHQLKTDDIVIARTGATIGKTYLCINPPIAVPASYLIRFRFRKNSLVLPRFFARYLQSPLFKQQLRPLIHGSCQPNITIRDLGQLTINLPEIEQQEKILETLGTTLDNIDKLVLCTQQKVEVYQKLKQAYLYEAFIGKSSS